MSIGSMMTMFAVGSLAVVGLGVGHAQAGGGDTPSTGGFQCVNKLDIQVVSCVGQIAVLPINVDVKDISALNDNDLSVLSNDLNHLSILDGDILDKNTILNHVEANVLTDFLDKFNIDVTKNDVDVCTAVLGISLCR